MFRVLGSVLWEASRSRGSQICTPTWRYLHCGHPAGALLARGGQRMKDPILIWALADTQQHSVFSIPSFIPALGPKAEPKTSKALNPKRLFPFSFSFALCLRNWLFPRPPPTEATSMRALRIRLVNTQQPIFTLIWSGEAQRKEGRCSSRRIRTIQVPDMWTEPSSSKGSNPESAILKLTFHANRM